VRSDTVNLASDSFTGERLRQAYYPRDGGLIVDSLLQLEGNCYPLLCVHYHPAFARPLRTSIRNQATKVTSVVRTALPALCLCTGTLLQYPVHGLRGCHPSHPHLHRLHRSSVEYRLIHVSPSSRTSASALRICGHLVHERSCQCRTLWTTPCTAVGAGRRSATVITIHPPFVLSCAKR
jgi:hypothetical protein